MLINACDKCKKPIDLGMTFFVQTGRSMDPSGNGYEAEGENIELCYKCQYIALIKALGYLTDEERALFLHYFSL